MWGGWGEASFCGIFEAAAACAGARAGSWAVEECDDGEGWECWWGVAFAAVGEAEEEVVEGEFAGAGWAEVGGLSSWVYTTA